MSIRLASASAGSCWPSLACVAARVSRISRSAPPFRASSAYWKLASTSRSPRITSQRTLFNASRASLYLPCLYSFSPSETSWLAEYSSWRLPRSGIGSVRSLLLPQFHLSSLWWYLIVMSPVCKASKRGLSAYPRFSETRGDHHEPLEFVQSRRRAFLKHKVSSSCSIT